MTPEPKGNMQINNMQINKTQQDQIKYSMAFCESVFSIKVSMYTGPFLASDDSFSCELHLCGWACSMGGHYLLSWLSFHNIKSVGKTKQNKKCLNKIKA